MTNFKEILFENTETKIFKNQKDLIDIILSDKKNIFFNKKRSSLASFISKLIRGERNPNTDFKSSVLTAIEKVGVSPELKTKCSEKFIELCEANYRSPSQRKNDFLYIKYDEKEIMKAMEMCKLKHSNITLFDLHKCLEFLQQ